MLALWSWSLHRQRKTGENGYVRLSHLYELTFITSCIRCSQKELKKLARAQAQGLAPGGIPGAPGTLPPPQVAPSHPNQPSPQQPPAALQVQPTHPKPHVPAVSIPPSTLSIRIATPTSAAPRSAVQSSAASQRTDTSALGGIRGKKRELEDGPALPPNPSTNGANTPIGLAGLRAGSNGVRPRPVKRIRMVSL